jgi:CBS domain-containing protein
MKVKDIMTKPLVVNKADTISHAMELMNKHDTRRLLVMNGNDFMGVITMRSIARKLGTWKTSNLPASSLHVATATSNLFTKVLPDTGFEDAVVLMDRSGGILVVTDNAKIHGWVTPHEILKYAKGVKGYASEIMKEPIVVSPGERVAHARRLLLDKDIGRLPIVEKTILSGSLRRETLQKV